MKLDRIVGGGTEAGLTARPLARAAARRSRIPGAPPRRWTINGDFFGLRPFGVARYARETTRALDVLLAEGHPLARDLDLDLVAPRQSGEALPLDAIRVRIVPEFRPRLPQVWAQLQLPRQVPGGLVSFCNLAPVAVRRHIVCIHDMHTRMTPESYGAGFRLAHRVVLPLLGRRAAAIATVSEFSRRQLAAFGVAPSEKVAVTYNGSDHALGWDPGRSSLPSVTRPYVLALGRREAHKNGALLRRLAPRLDALGLDLWIAGEGDGEGAPANLRSLGPVTDDDLARALGGAVCFLFPSRIEGFGLPAVEALALGCPVIASTAPCLPEICGDAALYADPDDDDGWIDRIAAVTVDAALRERQVVAGRARALAYSWRRVAEAYLELMAAVDSDDASRTPA